MAKVETIEALITSEAETRGLSLDEMCACMAKALQTRYARRGQHVNVFAAMEDGRLQIDVKEIVVIQGTAVEKTLGKLLVPSDEDLLQAVELYREEVTKRTPWLLAQAKVLTANADHYLVEVESEHHYGGQIAVLPRRYVGLQQIKTGANIMCVVQLFRKESVPGLEEWKQVEVPLQASMIDRQVIIQCVAKFFEVACEAVVMAGAAMIVVDPTVEISPIIGSGGKNLELLKRITGLRRVLVVKLSEQADPKRKLINYIVRVTGLKHPDSFHVVEPKLDDPEKLDWAVYVNASDHARLIGHQGHNLFFIMYLTSIQFKHFARKGGLTAIKRPSEPAHVD